MNVGDERAVPVLVIEKVQLILNSNVIILDDYHYYPSFLINIIFIGLLAKDGYNFFNKKNLWYHYEWCHDYAWIIETWHYSLLV